ncbi:MAG: DUF4838 domain-containing protein, partial [Clostridia bacterium]|nr:DUF4838 domain-containing protein [Clostridia bacterium]
MKGKKILSLILSLLLLCGGMTACLGSPPTPADTDTASPSSPDTTLPAEVTTSPVGEETANETDEDTSEEATAEVVEDTSEEVTESDVELPAPEPTLTIGGTDVAAFAVVRSADMPAGQVTVLNFLLEQIKAVYGAELPVITDDQTAEHEIIIGVTNRQSDGVEAACATIRNDGYAMVVEDGDLYLSATTGRGVVYAMADFMENYMGIRLYTQAFTSHRSTGAVTLEEGFTDVYSPAFEARRTWIDPLYSDPLEVVFYLKNNSDTLKKAKVGDNTPVRANSNHTIDNLAKVDGEAQVPCLTDEAVYAQVLKSVRKKLDDNTEQNVIQVGQGDGGQPCRCERCSAIHAEYGTDNATWFLFLNRLADEVASLYPDRPVRLITYSYQYTHGVPGNGYTVSDNVIINFCFDKACYNHAFNDPNCPKNAPVAAELKEWAKLCKADNLYVYEYAYNCGDKYLADPSLLVMWDNFHFYVECGVTGILAEGINSNGGEFDHLRAYLRSHLTWNPTMTEEAYYTLMEEFMADYYGDAAPLLREYMTILYDGQRVSCTDMYTPMYTFFQTDAEEGGTSVNQDVMSACWALFEQAFALETLTEEQMDHVEYTGVHFLMVRYTYYPK